MNVIELLGPTKEPYGFRDPLPLSETGYKLSIQASAHHYCQPRESGLENWEYTHWEVGLIAPDGSLVGGLDSPEAPSWWPAGEDVWGYASVEDINVMVLHALQYDSWRVEEYS